MRWDPINLRDPTGRGTAEDLQHALTLQSRNDRRMAYVAAHNGQQPGHMRGLLGALGGTAVIGAGGLGIAALITAFPAVGTALGVAGWVTAAGQIENDQNADLSAVALQATGLGLTRAAGATDAIVAQALAREAALADDAMVGALSLVDDSGGALSLVDDGIHGGAPSQWTVEGRLTPSAVRGGAILMQPTQNSCGVACGLDVLGDDSVGWAEFAREAGFHGGTMLNGKPWPGGTPSTGLAEAMRNFSGDQTWRAVQAMNLTPAHRVALMRNLSSQGRWMAQGNNHWITVEGVGARQVQYLDPSDGLSKSMSIDDFLNWWQSGSRKFEAVGRIVF